MKDQVKERRAGGLYVLDQTVHEEWKRGECVSTLLCIIRSRCKVPTEEANAHMPISPFDKGARQAFAFLQGRIVVVVMIVLCDDGYRDRRCGSKTGLIIPASSA
jgi:hypothetical protein